MKLCSISSALNHPFSCTQTSPLIPSSPGPNLTNSDEHRQHRQEAIGLDDSLPCSSPWSGILPRCLRWLRDYSGIQMQQLLTLSSSPSPFTCKYPSKQY